jgi:hypothetical protein
MRFRGRVFRIPHDILDFDFVPVEVFDVSYLPAQVFAVAIEAVDGLVPEIGIRQARKSAYNGIGHPGFDAFESGRFGKKNPQGHVAELEEVPGPFVAGKREVGFYEYITIHFKYFCDFRRHLPGHGEMFEAGAREDNIKFGFGIKIGGKFVGVAGNIHIPPRVIIEADVFSDS